MHKFIWIVIKKLTNKGAQFSKQNLTFTFSHNSFSSNSLSEQMLLKMLIKRLF